ncbi:probable serine/threonine-protein kinase PBL19 [Andrographis paniculata]|uniref:probable serine/threonine-protein kinase PBL19 n=1 Tax=Andrographis paniculata TaxID=175694 RepID=UPI0021E951D3|nr:probable serine/threonine-protein kinase PBL19 [Andrographis paniculata]
MKCFYNYFKDRSRGREQKSAPISNNNNLISNNYGASEISDGTATKSSASARSIPELYEEKGHNHLRVFTFSELKHATNNFSRLLKIGEGGFGCVYKGALKPDNNGADPLVVAVKKLNRDGYQGHKQWVAEVQFLGVVEHPNLVKLIGYCAVDAERGIQRLLVYEYMTNKSLDDHLFNKSYPALSWDRRLQIALGAAQGLAYLHEELEVQVIYRDFKSSNVLLDDEFKPKLSDFGLAREGPEAGHTHVSTAVVGTYGYAAPDYIETGHLTTKSDVWSFGVVLYEVLTGRRSLERDRPRPEQKLLDWIKHHPVDSKKFVTIIDPRFDGKYSLAAARRIAKLADACLVKSAKDRPRMSEVVETLKQIVRDDVDGDGDGHAGPMWMSVDNDEDEEEENEEKPRGGAEESRRRRMAHLAKLSEHVGGGASRRWLMMIHRPKVT